MFDFVMRLRSSTRIGRTAPRIPQQKPRVTPALEQLETRLVPTAFFPNLTNAQFRLLDSAVHVGSLVVQQENLKTGQFSGVFQDGYGLTTKVGGQVGQETTSHLYTSLFFQNGLTYVPYQTGVTFLGTLYGGGTNGNVHGHDALQGTVDELFIDIFGHGWKRDVTVLGSDSK